MALMTDPTGLHWGYGLSKQAGVRSGVLYPLLGRMLRERWLEDGWENPAEIVDGRPPRRYYELTAKGKSELGAILAAASSDVRFRSLLDPRFGRTALHG